MGPETSGPILSLKKSSMKIWIYQRLGSGNNQESSTSDLVECVSRNKSDVEEFARKDMISFTGEKWYNDFDYASYDVEDLVDIFNSIPEMYFELFRFSEIEIL